MAVHVLEQLARRIEIFSGYIGRTISWLTLLMMLTMTLVVTLRYGFNLGWIWLQETVLYLHAFVLMLAMPFSLLKNEHVRVDIFYRKMSVKNRNRVDVAGHLLFLIPTCCFILFMSWGYVSQSWQITESSQEAGGLPLVFILKTLLILMPSLLIIQAISAVIKILIEPKLNAIKEVN